jgi:hypothetical protein
MASHRPPPIDRSTINGWRPQSPLPGYQGPPTVQTGKHGSWQFEDANPAEIVSTPGTVAAPVRSAFQSYLIAFRDWLLGAVGSGRKNLAAHHCSHLF